MTDAPEIETIDIGSQIHTRLADLSAPASMDAEARTVDVVWSTGAAVKRRDLFTGEQFVEVLDLSGANLDRLNAGAPFLKMHESYDLRSVIGSVVPGSARVDGSEAVATIRMSDREDVADIWSDIQAGHVRAVSIGYQVERFVVEKMDGQPDVWRAVDWTPYEISAVVIAADPDAMFRAADAQIKKPCYLTRAIPATEQSTSAEDKAAMTDETNRAAVPEAENKIADVDVGNERAAPAPAPVPPPTDFVALERERCAEIYRRCNAFKLGSDFADELVRSGVTIEEARGKILDRAADISDRTAPTRPHVVFPTDGLDEVVTRRQAMTTAMLNRYQPGEFKIDEPARQYQHMSLIDLARASLEDSGHRTRGMHYIEIAERAMQGTTDFTYVLGAVTNKSLLSAYMTQPRNYQLWASQTTVNDFKPKQLIDFGAAPQLSKVNEHGEFKYGYLKDAAEVVQVATYGMIVAITRQAIINDDLDAFTTLPAQFGAKAAALENDVVFGILTANAAMNDSVALFHATHKNLAATGTAISIDSIGAARSAMLKQTDLSGNYLRITPSYILVPTAKEVLASQLLSPNIVPNASTGAVPSFIQSLTPISDPRLDESSPTAWYLVAGGASGRGVVYAYLAGNAGPQVISEPGFDVDGVKFRVRHDFGAGPSDFRTLYKNPGA